MSTAELNRLPMAEFEHISPSSIREEQLTRPRRGRVERGFEALASRTSRLIGSSWSFGLAALVIVVWALTGPLFHYSDTWQLVINTGTTIITFLMVFLLQHTQNKDGMAIQLKLDELLATIEGASNRMIDIEELDEADLLDIKERYQKLVDEVSRLHEERSSMKVQINERQSRTPNNK
jgi:low affinity Fe/Cu permease